MDSMGSTKTSIALMDAMRALRAQNTNAVDVAKAIEFDPVLSENILKEVNSPFFALKFKVEALEQAIALLGFDRLLYLLRNSVSSDMYEMAQGSYYEMLAFRKHGVAVGCLAEQLAILHRMEYPKEFFQAGISHDLGKYFYLTKLSEHFKHLMQEMKLTQTPMYMLERVYLGVDHTELGEMMADAWGVPDTVRCAIRFHHELSEKEMNRLTSREAQVVEIVSFANLISHGNAIQTDPLPKAPGILTDGDVQMAKRVAEKQFREIVMQMGLE
jgi:HD-like signal output (HDOD) protein